MPYDNIILEVQGGTGIIKINRPKALNALNAATCDDLLAAAGELAGNPDIKVIVVTGQGDKAFVAGADIQEMLPMNPMQDGLLTKGAYGHVLPRADE